MEMVRGVLNRVPVVEVSLDGRQALAIVDTGCSRSMVKRRNQGAVVDGTSVLAFDGREVKCYGYDDIRLVIGEKTVRVRVRVTEALVGGVDVIVGMDVIEELGGVTLADGKVMFGDATSGLCAMVPCRERENLI